MRNLVVITEEHGVVDDNTTLQVAAAAVDVDNGFFFVASQAPMLICYSLRSSKVEWVVPLDEEGGPVVAMEWRVEVEAVVVGRSGGQVVEVSDSGLEVQEVGSLQGGLLAMAASPDGELLLLVTGAGQLLVMTQDWDQLYEVSLGKDLDTSGSVQLSWRGDGKYFATLVTGNGSSSSAEQLKIWERETGTMHAVGESTPFIQTALSWCPSGARIVTSCSQPNNQSPPQIILFEKNGLKRDKFQLEGPLETQVISLKWNSNSELLAMVVKNQDWISVQIWNCNNYHWYLKQELRYPSSEELNVVWDPEDAMKLVCWTASGTVRTLKLGWKSAVLESSTALVINGHNLLVSPLSLALIPPPMSLFTITFQAPVQVVAFTQQTDGCSLIAARLSDGSLSVVRCPKLADWLDLDSENYNACSLSVLSDLRQSISELRHLTWLRSGALLGALSVQPSLGNTGSNGKFSGTQNGVFSKTYPGSQEILVEVDLEGTEDNSSLVSDSFQIQGVQETPVKQAVVSIMKNPVPLSQHGGDAFVQLDDGTVVMYTESQGASNFGRMVIGAFQSPSPLMEVLRFGTGEVKLVGLNDRGRLELLQHSILCNDCTSFATHWAADSRSHLLYTTQRDSLHVVDLSDLSSVSDAESKQEVNMRPGSRVGRKPKAAGAQEEELKVRPLWERGAKLLTALGGQDVAVVMQTIRGNLETIYPRSLVLGAIAEALKQDHYSEAMGLTRRHHINLNVIVDYGGWENFCTKASEFVKQVGKLNHITELVYALNYDNIVDTSYKNLLPPFPTAVGAKDARTELMKSQLPGSKVQGVLKALKEAVEKEVASSPGKELCILAMLAKSQPPELKEALHRVKSLREAELQGEIAVELEAVEEGGKDLNKAILSAEAALKHLLWLSDAEIVFKEALGLYDLHLAAMVASHAQRDPKEFLPLLKELEDMPEHMMRFKIDSRLGRYESALRNLALGGEPNFSECLQLIVDHAELFPLGLQMFKEPGNRAAILEVWGDHLVEQEKFEDAAAAYCSCNRLEKAMGAYRSGGLWQGVMTMAGQLHLSREETDALASDLGEELQAMGRPADAACVALEYNNDVDSGVRLLLEAREWMEAVRVSSLYAWNMLIGSLVEPAALECASALIEEFTEGLEKVRKYHVRYQTVRQRRLSLAAKLKAEEDGEWPDDDTISEASSHVSGMSAYTHGTASSVTTGSGRGRKSSARSQAKKSKGGRIRAGSPGEELGLIEYVRGMAVSKRMLEEVRRLLGALLLLGHYDVASRVQAALALFQATQKAAQESVEEEARIDDAVETMRPVTSAASAPAPAPAPGVAPLSLSWRLAVLETPEAPQHISSNIDCIK